MVQFRRWPRSPSRGNPWRSEEGGGGGCKFLSPKKYIWIKFSWFRTSVTRYLLLPACAFLLFGKWPELSWPKYEKIEFVKLYVHCFNERHYNNFYSNTKQSIKGMGRAELVISYCHFLKKVSQSSLKRYFFQVQTEFRVLLNKCYVLMTVFILYYKIKTKPNKLLI